MAAEKCTKKRDARAKLLSAYHLYGNFGEKFSSNGTGIFFGTENRNGDELYHLQNTGKYFAFSRLEAWHWQCKQMGQKISVVFGKSGKKVMPRKVLLFFRKISTGMNSSI